MEWERFEEMPEGDRLKPWQRIKPSAKGVEDW